MVDVACYEQCVIGDDTSYVVRSDDCVGDDDDDDGEKVERRLFNLSGLSRHFFGGSEI